jgi:hypothetical protein
LLLGLFSASACGGYPDGLVVVKVGGLVSSITELRVTVQLDGAPAKNTKPQADLGDLAFVVHDDMQRFGVQVPSGTQTLGLSITGYNTNLEVVRSGSAMLSLATGPEFDVLLQ